MCDGYPYRPVRPTRVKRFKKLLPNVDALTEEDRLLGKPPISHQPSLQPGFEDELEYTYFQLFKEDTASELSGYFDNDVWNRLVLQICHEEAYARQAVIAIGALTKTTAIAATSSEKFKLLDSSANRHYNYALQQYGKALRLMQDIRHQGTSTRFRNTLISSLLTTCFETYIGNQENAIAQSKAGVDVLLQNQNWELAGWKGGNAGLDLVSTFTRLNVQVLMFNNTAAPHHIGNDWNIETSFPMLPSTFDSAKEARDRWDLIAEACMLWRAASHPDGYTTLDFAENTLRDSMSKSDLEAQKVQHEMNWYMTITEEWFRVFQPIFERSRAKKGSKDFLGASILMIKYLSSRVAMPAQDGDENEDDALKAYVTIVDLAREALEADDEKHPRGKPLFLFDDSLVVGLFIVATRCRERTIRRQAIALMRQHPRREGFWDTSMATTVATWFMETEEEGLEGDFIPPSARMTIVKNDFVLSERKAVVKCSRIAAVEGSADLPEVTLTW